MTNNRTIQSYSPQILYMKSTGLWLYKCWNNMRNWTEHKHTHTLNAFSSPRTFQALDISVHGYIFHTCAILWKCDNTFKQMCLCPHVSSFLLNDFLSGNILSLFPSTVIFYFLIMQSHFQASWKVHIKPDQSLYLLFHNS